jgi:hypothetical protein
VWNEGSIYFKEQYSALITVRQRDEGRKRKKAGAEALHRHKKSRKIKPAIAGIEDCQHTKIESLPGRAVMC